MESPKLAVILLAVVVRVRCQYHSPYGPYPGFAGDSPSGDSPGGMYGSPYSPYPPPPGPYGGYGGYPPQDVPEAGEGPSSSPYGSPYGGGPYQDPGFYPPPGAYPGMPPYGPPGDPPENPQYPPLHGYGPPLPPPRPRLMAQRRPPMSMAIDGAGALPLESPPVGIWSPTDPIALPLLDTPFGGPGPQSSGRTPQAVDGLFGPGRKRGSTMTRNLGRPAGVMAPTCGSPTEPAICCAPPRVCSVYSRMEDETGKCTVFDPDSTCCASSECRPPGPRRRRVLVRRRRPKAGGGPNRRPGAPPFPRRAPARTPGGV